MKKGAVAVLVVVGSVGLFVGVQLLRKANDRAKASQAAGAFRHCMLGSHKWGSADELKLRRIELAALQSSGGEFASRWPQRCSGHAVTLARALGEFDDHATDHRVRDAAEVLSRGKIDGGVRTVLKTAGYLDPTPASGITEPPTSLEVADYRAPIFAASVPRVEGEYWATLGHTVPFLLGKTACRVSARAASCKAIRGGSNQLWGSAADTGPIWGLGFAAYRPIDTETGTQYAAVPKGSHGLSGGGLLALEKNEDGSGLRLSKRLGERVLSTVELDAPEPPEQNRALVTEGLLAWVSSGRDRQLFLRDINSKDKLSVGDVVDGGAVTWRWKDIRSCATSAATVVSVRMHKTTRVAVRSAEGDVRSHVASSRGALSCGTSKALIASILQKGSLDDKKDRRTYTLYQEWCGAAGCTETETRLPLKKHASSAPGSRNEDKPQVGALGDKVLVVWKSAAGVRMLLAAPDKLEKADSVAIYDGRAGPSGVSDRSEVRSVHLFTRPRFALVALRISDSVRLLRIDESGKVAVVKL